MYCHTISFLDRSFFHTQTLMIGVVAMSKAMEALMPLCTVPAAIEDTVPKKAAAIAN